jgi:serine protease Do
MRHPLHSLFFPAALAALLSGCRLDVSRGGGNRPEPDLIPPPSADAKRPSSGPDIEFDSLPQGAKPRLPPGLDNFQQVFADVAEKAVPAVVSISSEHNVAGGDDGDGRSYDDFTENGPFRFFFGTPGEHGAKPHKETGLGSGVIISPAGYILTNNHVIEGADAIKVTLNDESEFMAEIVGTDKPSDVAVIKLKGVKGRLPTLPLGDSDKLRIGEWVVAVGNPYGLSQTVTTGIISAKGRKNTGINSYENFLQTDAAINPGNSGGALLNLSGELIGINTAIFSRSGGYQGIGFAIPISMAKKITRDLIRDGEVTRGWLGVSIQPLDPEIAEAMGLKGGKDGSPAHGALVGGVVPGSPAETAGIKRGDVITKVDEAEIKDANDLLNRIALLTPDQWVHVWVLREGMTLDCKARISKRDEKRLASYHGEESGEGDGLAGLRIEGMSKELREKFHLGKTVDHGVVVTGVEPESRAAKARLREGDVILEVNRKPVKNPEGFRASMAQATRGNKILLLVNRNASTFFTTL